MEVVVIVVLVIAALAAVLYPILRKGDEPAGQPARRPVQGAVATGDPVKSSARELEADVRRYREALRAGTLCRRCAEANGPSAQFCTRCGSALPRPEPPGEAVGAANP